MLLGSGDENLFHKGIYFVVYEIILEIGGLLFIIGCAWFLVRLLAQRRRRRGRLPEGKTCSC